MQTIAHNTVVVDQKTQHGADEKLSDQRWAARHFFDASKPNVQVMSARDDNSYPGVNQQRTMLLLRDARLPYPVVLDVFRLAATTQHTFDYPVHFRGQLIATNAKYTANTTTQSAL